MTRLLPDEALNSGRLLGDSNSVPDRKLQRPPPQMYEVTARQQNARGRARLARNQKQQPLRHAGAVEQGRGRVSCATRMRLRDGDYNENFRYYIKKLFTIVNHLLSGRPGQCPPQLSRGGAASPLGPGAGAGYGLGGSAWSGDEEDPRTAVGANLPTRNGKARSGCRDDRESQ